MSTFAAWHNDSARVLALRDGLRNGNVQLEYLHAARLREVRGLGGIARRGENVETTRVKDLGHGPADAAGAAARNQDRLLLYRVAMVSFLDLLMGDGE